VKKGNVECDSLFYIANFKSSLVSSIKGENWFHCF